MVDYGFIIKYSNEEKVHVLSIYFEARESAKNTFDKIFFKFHQTGNLSQKFRFPNNKKYDLENKT